jgi:hypothetical protein
MRNAFEILVGISEGKGHLRYLDAEGMIMWPGFFWIVHLIASVKL